MSDTFSGLCVGGPLDGQRVTVRTAAGFVAANRVNHRAYVYVLTAPGRLEICTDHDDSLVYPQGPTTGERRFDPARAWEAGESSAVDFIALD